MTEVYELEFISADTNVADRFARTLVPFTLAPGQPAIVTLNFVIFGDPDPDATVFTVAQSNPLVGEGFVSIEPMQASYTFAEIGTQLVVNSYGTPGAGPGITGVFALYGLTMEATLPGVAVYGLTGTLTIPSDVPPRKLATTKATVRGRFI